MCGSIYFGVFNLLPMIDHAKIKHDKRVCLKAISDIKWYLCDNGHAQRNGLDNKTAVVLFAKIKYNIEFDNSVTKSDYNKWLLHKILNGDIDKINKLSLRISPSQKRKNLYAKSKPKLKTKVKIKTKKSSKDKYKEFLKSEYWKEVKKVILIRDGKKCTQCGCKKLLNIHHLTYANHMKEHEHPEDLITLCRVCHQKVHGLI